MTISELQLLLLAVFAISAGLALKKPDPRAYSGWVALVSGIALGVVCLLILFDLA